LLYKVIAKLNASIFTRTYNSGNVLSNNNPVCRIEMHLYGNCNLKTVIR